MHSLSEAGMELNLRVPDLPLGLYPTHPAVHLYKNYKTFDAFHVGLRRKNTFTIEF